ncbi:MAG: hypothetical protein L0Z62_31370 [Gemmataceae bacterium]|nr:hypothetical protein [Gemmataceae bacterium]
MSRTRFSSRRPQRGGTFRPQLEALDERFAPGGLLGASPAASDLALAWLQANQQQAATQTTSPVVAIADGSVRGESTLLRTDHGVGIHLNTSGLLPGVYTAWWAVFNTPGQGPPTVGFATSHVVGPSGTASFAAHLNEGETLLGHPLSGGSLVDARTAEIHLVIRYHGPADPGRLDEQLHSFEPGLDTDADPNTRNVQVTIHPPPA